MKTFFIVLLLCTSCNTVPNSPSSLNLPFKADVIIQSAKKAPPDTPIIISTAETLYADDKIVKQMEQTIVDSKIKDAKGLSNILRICILASAIMLVGGIFATMYEQPLLGMALILGSIALTAFATMLIEYLWLVALISSGIFILLLCILAYKFYYMRKTLYESIMTTEVLKDSGTSWEDNVPFINKLQSPKTKKLIREIKDKEVKL